mmetsp:Transcript_1335/g.5302  ORF Transcript_1335/g.5302 Transcript_1335/m.5302 type:complete len:352 (-) Transcript_1335:282-1337(-)
MVVGPGRWRTGRGLVCTARRIAGRFDSHWHGCVRAKHSQALHDARVRPRARGAGVHVHRLTRGGRHTPCCHHCKPKLPSAGEPRGGRRRPGRLWQQRRRFDCTRERGTLTHWQHLLSSSSCRPASRLGLLSACDNGLREQKQGHGVCPDHLAFQKGANRHRSTNLGHGYADHERIARLSVAGCQTPRPPRLSRNRERQRCRRRVPVANEKHSPPSNKHAPRPQARSVTVGCGEPCASPVSKRLESRGACRIRPSVWQCPGARLPCSRSAEPRRKPRADPATSEACRSRAGCGRASASLRIVCPCHRWKPVMRWAGAAGPLNDDFNRPQCRDRQGACLSLRLPCAVRHCEPG